MSAAGSGGAPPVRTPESDDLYKWKAFIAIGISFITQVMSISMVFVALSAIADDFDVTLRAASWVVVAQALTISALMMPMGRLADIIGWKRVHLTGLALFAGGCVFIALAPTFGVLIFARVVMATGNAMGQSVGTAMMVSVFPPSERGTAIGSQTTAVSIGGASGPIIAGLLLQVLPWEALFWMLVIPIGIAFVAGYFILDDARLNQPRAVVRPAFDYTGAVLSALAIALLVITINNPLRESWTSPLILGGLGTVALLLVTFVRWELRSAAPMIELRLFRSRAFTMAIITRFLGFLGATVTRFLMPLYLISLRGLEEAATGGVLFLSALGLGLAAQAAGRLSDRFGPRPFAIIGLCVLVATSLPMAFLTAGSPLWIVMVLLFVNGLGMGLWNVPNISVIMGSVPPSRLGVVGAFSDLTRNVGNVTGQAIAAGVIVAAMVASGFDVPISEIADNPGAGEGFIDGWRTAYLLVTAYSVVGLVLAIFTKLPPQPPAPTAPPQAMPTAGGAPTAGQPAAGQPAAGQSPAEQPQ